MKTSSSDHGCFFDFQSGILASVLLLLACFPAAAAGSSVSLDLDSVRIVLPEQPHPAERYAADELQNFIGQATGQQADIQTKPTSNRSGTILFVGPSDAMTNARSGFDPDALAPEAVRFRARDGSVSIAGGSPRGTLYATYVFLERSFGVRFLTPDHTHVPERNSSITVETSYQHTPPLRFRYSYYAPVRKHPAFAARMRINAVPRKRKHGGRTGFRNVNHTFSQFVSWGTYGAKHPEYFALHDGHRPKGVEHHQTYEFQLCPTEPAVRKIIIRKVLKRLKNHPDRKVVSVSQSDNHRYCRCSDCRAINKKEGSPMGAQLDLVNAVAKAVEKKHPDVLVGTLAYQYTRKPPKHRTPRDNVLIQLCSFEACQVHAMDNPDCPLNTSFRRDMKAWSRKAKHLSIWNYNVNFRDYLAPVPNIYNIGTNVKFFAKHGVISAFMQGDAARGGEFAHLRNYLICRLLWNPDLDPDRLMDEFLRLHYKKAAPQVRNLIDHIHHMARDGIHHGDSHVELHAYGLDAGKLADVFKRELEKANNRSDAAVTKRLDRLTVIQKRLRIQPLVDHFYEILRKNRFKPLPNRMAKRLRPRFDAFIKACNEQAIEQVNEGTSVKKFEKIGRALLGTGEVPEVLQRWLDG